MRIYLDILRRCQSWKDKGVIFVHVPKAAGVSVSKALYGRPLGHFSAKDVRRYCPETFAALHTFSVVRHPLTRLYSAYRFSRTGGTSEMGLRNAGLYQTEDFSTFDRFVGKWLVHQDLSSLDGIFRPQHLYVCDESTIIVDQIIRLEDIDQGMQILSSHLGRKIELGHHNKSIEQHIMEGSSETLSIIQSLYRIDFELFGYTPDVTS